MRGHVQLFYCTLAAGSRQDSFPTVASEPRAALWRGCSQRKWGFETVTGAQWQTRIGPGPDSKARRVSFESSVEIPTWEPMHPPQTWQRAKDGQACGH